MDNFSQDVGDMPDSNICSLLNEDNNGETQNSIVNETHNSILNSMGGTENYNIDISEECREIDNIILNFNLIHNPTVLDELKKSQMISDIIYKNNQLNNKTRLLSEIYFEHLSDIDNKYVYLHN